MPKNQNSNIKKVNFDEMNDNESISLQIDDNFYSIDENKKILTYDDMLASMCMRVQNGNLCMIKDDFDNDQFNFTPSKPSNQNIPKSPKINVNTLNNNSYIYNKYFEKYKQNDKQNDQQNDLNYLQNLFTSGQITREDYKKAVLTKLINDRNEKIRLQKIKSKKLLFSNSNINISGANIGRTPSNMNQLFRFVGPGPIPYNQNRPIAFPNKNTNTNINTTNNNI
jgi:hypothetical protein